MIYVDQMWKQTMEWCYDLMVDKVWQMHYFDLVDMEMGDSKGIIKIFFA